MIEDTAKLVPRSDQIVEDLAIRIDARETLEQAGKKAETRS
jgi:hypothetical protein